ncbi:MAG: molecular chaperone TorD family protein, partial [Planctomycetaceae bacterium]
MTSLTTERSRLAAAAGARSVVYHGLATLFRHPDRMWTETVSRGQLFAALRESIHALKLPECLIRLEILERSWHGLLHAKRSPSAEHVRLYGAHGGVKCPPFATEFGQRHSFSKVQDLADIQGCFAAFGVSLSSDAADRPDHVSFLLDFL